MYLFYGNFSRCLNGYFCPIVYGAVILILQFLSSTAIGIEVSDWSIDECGKCHSFKVRMISSDGGKHAEEISCVDCHPGHPPGTERVTMDCIDCHDGRAHFTIGNCFNCHIDPHRPLVTLRDTLKPARMECISCHDDIGAEMVKFPSLHAELFCTSCHSRHKEVPGCLDCHSPHELKQSDKDCSLCHSPHSPGEVVLRGYIQASFCRTCHRQQADDLAETKTTHGGLNCTNCHKDFHPNLPECRDCHGLPHNQDIHRHFRDCLECHEDAHNLISHQ